MFWRHDDSSCALKSVSASVPDLGHFLLKSAHKSESLAHHELCTSIRVSKNRLTVSRCRQADLEMRNAHGI